MLHRIAQLCPAICLACSLHAAPIVTDFSDTQNRDADGTTANWSTGEEALLLAAPRPQAGNFDSATTAISIYADPGPSRRCEVGDVNGDGFKDIVVAYRDEPNRLYLHNGTDTPFANVTPLDITADAHRTEDVSLGDYDGDGDLDVVAVNVGTFERPRVYFNNGTGDPFDGVTGEDLINATMASTSIESVDIDLDGDLDVIVGISNARNRIIFNNGTSSPFDGESQTISWDPNRTVSMATGDVDGDGDIDVVTVNRNDNRRARLYLNDGTPDMFPNQGGTDIGTDEAASEAVALGDMDGDGDLDVVVGNFVAPNRLYLNNGTSTPFAGVTGIAFGISKPFTRALAVADIDGDGDLDVATGTSDAGGSANRVFLNNGTPSPFAGVTGTNLTNDPLQTSWLELADMNNDGAVDAVTTNFDSGGRLYLNGGVVDPFYGVSGMSLSGIQGDSNAIVSGDLDGDGDLDLVVGNSGINERNLYYLNNGTANPFQGVTGRTVSSDTRRTQSMALGDVDRDGDLDLVAGNTDGASILYLGNGTSTPFARARKLTIPNSVDTAYDVELADMDGDGDLDLVVGTLGSGLADHLYLNNGSSDPFNGASRLNIGSDSRTYDLAVGDVDNDGDLDVVNGRTLYLNNGTANPFAGVTGSNVHTSTGIPNAVILGDVNKDGWLDLVTGGSGSDPAEIWINDQSGIPFRNSPLSISNRTDLGPWDLGFGDMNNDGYLDVVMANSREGGITNRVYLNNRTDDPFQDGSDQGTDLTDDSHFTRALTIGDFDRDGALDVVVANANSRPNRVYFNNDGPRGWAGGTCRDISPSKQPTRAVATGDVDRDGDIDVIAANNTGSTRLYLNDGTARVFDGMLGIAIAGDSRKALAAELADLDGDGHLDLLVGSDDQANYIYYNTGTEAPFDGVPGFRLANALGDERDTTALAIGDLNGDGHLDVLVGNGSDDSQYYLNNGTANPFNGVNPRNLPFTWRGTEALAVGDVDRDGDLDVVKGNRLLSNQLLLNNGSGNPFNGVTPINFPGLTNFSTNDVVLADMDGDGDLDLVEGNKGQSDRLFLNNGTSNPFSGTNPILISSGDDKTQSIAVGDVDDDGDLDLVTGRSYQPNRLYLNSGGANPFSGVVPLAYDAEAHDSKGITLADVDCDGQLDIISGNAGQPARLCRNGAFNTSGNIGLSRPFNVVRFQAAILQAVADVPPHTSVRYFMTNHNVADHWYEVEPGEYFVFPTFGGYLRWRVELSSLSPSLTPRVDSVTVEVNQQPEAQSLSLTGDLLVDSVLTANMTYFDADGDLPGQHIYQWYRADDLAGINGVNEVAIPGATESTYVPTPEDVGKYIKFHVMPVALTGHSPGADFKSKFHGRVSKIAVRQAVNQADPASPVYGEPVDFTFGLRPVAPSTSTPVGPLEMQGGTGGVLATADFDGIANLPGGGIERVLQIPQSALPVGRFTYTMAYAGNDTFLPFSATRSIDIAKANTTLSITSDLPENSTVGQAVTVTWGLALDPRSTVPVNQPTGMVTLSAPGASPVTAPLSDGRAAIVLLAAGTQEITAAYSGDGNFNGSSDTEPHTVQSQVSLATGSALIAEDSASTSTFVVSRDGDTNAPLSVEIEISGTAERGSDYVLSGEIAGTTVTIPAGSASTTLVLDPTEDDIVELDEDIVIVVLPGTTYTLLAPFAGSTLLRNDDAAVLSIAPASATETDSGNATMTFAVTLSQPVDVPVSVGPRSNPATASDADFVHQAIPTLEFPPSTTSASIEVAVLPDNIDETDEEMEMHLFTLLADGRDVTLAGGGTTIMALGTIEDDDFSPVAIADQLHTVVEDGSLFVDTAGGVLANDTDQDDGDGPAHLTAVLLVDPLRGTLDLGPAGAFRYSPDPNYFGPDSFTYAASDGTNQSNPIQVDLEVTELVDLRLFAAADRAVVGAPGDVTHTITLTNIGPSDATAVVIDLTSVIPAGVTGEAPVVSAGSTSGTQWMLDLDEAGVATLQVTYHVSSNARGGIDILSTTGTVASLDQALTNPGDDSASVATSIISPADIGVLEVDATPGLSLQTGLFTQRVTVTNNNPLPLAGFRLLIGNLPSDVQVFNADGTTPGGSAFIESNQDLAPGGSVTLTVEFFRPSLDPNFAPAYSIEAVFAEDPAEPAPGATGADLDRILALADGSRLLEFSSIPGNIYAIEYSHDMVTWKRVSPSITANANRTQWIDSGPPKTESHPTSVTTRYYRVAPKFNTLQHTER